MTIFKNTYNVLIALSALAASVPVSSCGPGAMDGDRTDGDGGVTATLTLRLFQPSPVTQTRAGSETLTDANVLVLNSGGSAVGCAYLTVSPSSGTVKTRAGSSVTVCAVGNTGVAGYLDGVSSLSELKKKSVAVTAAAGVDPAKNGVLYGSAADITVNSDGTTSPSHVDVKLNRLYSMFIFNITPSSRITVLGYQICHVPLSSYVVPQKTSNPGGKFADFDLMHITSPAAGVEGTTGTYYMFENLQGTAAASKDEKSRNSANAPTDASYINIYATDGTWTKTFRIYLGGLTTDDYTNFDIPRNYSYTYNVNIESGGTDDARVTTTETITNLADADSWKEGGSTAATEGSGTGSWNGGSGSGTGTSGTSGSSNTADAYTWGTGGQTGATGSSAIADWSLKSGSGSGSSNTTGSSNSTSGGNWGGSGSTGGSAGGNSGGNWNGGSGNGSSSSSTGHPGTGGDINCIPWAGGTATGAADIGGNGSWSSASGSASGNSNTTGSSNGTSGGNWNNSGNTAATTAGNINCGWTATSGSGSSSSGTTGSNNSTGGGTWSAGNSTGATNNSGTGTWSGTSGNGTGTSGTTGSSNSTGGGTWNSGGSTGATGGGSTSGSWGSTSGNGTGSSGTTGSSNSTSGGKWNSGGSTGGSSGGSTTGSWGGSSGSGTATSTETKN